MMEGTGREEGVGEGVGEGGGGKAVVTVTIGGDEYRIRASASPEYAIRCAEYVDAKLGELTGAGRPLEPHKAAILVAMALADELFEARARLEADRQAVAEAAGRLAADAESALAG